jgi:hypothetical protein
LKGDCDSSFRQVERLDPGSLTSHKFRNTLRHPCISAFNLAFFTLSPALVAFPSASAAAVAVAAVAAAAAAAAVAVAIGAAIGARIKLDTLRVARDCVTFFILRRGRITKCGAGWLGRETASG